MVVSPQRLTRWPSYVRDRHAAITYTTPRDAPTPNMCVGSRGLFRNGHRDYRWTWPTCPAGSTTRLTPRHPLPMPTPPAPPTRHFCSASRTLPGR
ncbi:hypothetical protein CKJ55_24850 [Mycobacterium avium]|nr:hypothetical protein CKJ55_24850 [Mycobacterium avium]PBA86465.1 hypothetical protein CKJ71_10590 [Mycobacterium avium]